MRLHRVYFYDAEPLKAVATIPLAAERSTLAGARGQNSGYRPLITKTVSRQGLANCSMRDGASKGRCCKRRPTNRDWR